MWRGVERRDETEIVKLNCIRRATIPDMSPVFPLGSCRRIDCESQWGTAVGTFYCVCELFMTTVNFRVLQGADRGRSYLDLKLPITIGREEGNAIQLNDERISRFHIKIQEDNRHIVLTDLDSTNGSRVNGMDCQLRILRFGDIITVGRSVLLYGTREEISVRLEEGLTGEPNMAGSAKDADFELVDLSNAQSLRAREPEPKIPERLSPSQAAQLSELLEFVHGQLGTVINSAKIPDQSSIVKIDAATWQLMLQSYSRLSELIRSVADPEY